MRRYTTFDVEILTGRERWLDLGVDGKLVR
jgi:hypothetical protein